MQAGEWIPGAIHYRKLEEARELLNELERVLSADDPDVIRLHQDIEQAEEIQANCDHKGWCWSDSLDLICGRCGASLWRLSRELLGKK